MIGRLVGKIIEIKPPLLLIDVNGVGYEVFVSMNTLYQLDEHKKEVVLYTHFVVREDAQQLYGFYCNKERELFRSLIKVNGVGPKLALSILSSIDADRFVQAVHDQDTGSLVKIPGIGKKTAERLIIEMRDRLADATTEFVASSDSFVRQDAISALIALGYKSQDATRVLSGIEANSSAELIRLALKQLAI